MPLTADTLARALRAAVQAQALHLSPDAMRGGQPMAHPPSVDLAVVAFPSGGPPVGANVLLSREHPEGHVAALPADFGPVQGLRFDADRQDADGNSIAWWPDTDWRTLPWEPLWGAGPARFVAPYPASVLKLQVAVGVALVLPVNGWSQAWTHAGRERPLRDWLFDMLAVSCNTSTSALVAWLHAQGALRTDGHDALHRLWAALQLPTFRLKGTQPDGGWGNAAGAGVGRIQMTAWDTVRLMWWLDPDAPAAPWLSPDAPRLPEPHRQELLRGLRGQGLDIVLSSATLAGLPGWVEGIPAQVQPGWVQPDGRWRADDRDYPPAVRPRTEQVRFAHKIGNTENYAADAGIVQALQTGGRHYLIALFSNLGQRYAPHPRAAGPWGLPALGAAVDAFLTESLA
ncbi:hypothetical protein [Inhella crocodyli]|uniref:Serine hydrolase n=1 Tax=Inhella crocodyli TaxID=2499851 RepID=A0A3S2VHW5_9BURK|nr:hypothetical protein [Inhella crocodyli]RVT87589.1 hypothetical protein EOD73_00750 [Inhella crocodyli]